MWNRNQFFFFFSCILDKSLSTINTRQHDNHTKQQRQIGMEKFSKWRDPGTGIAVFVPATNAYSPKTPAVAVAETVILTALRMVKLPFVLIALAIHLLVMFTPWRKYSLRLLLLVLGVGTIKLIDDRRNTKTPRTGDVVVSNYSSPLDSLVYASMYDCIFVLPTGDDNKFRQVSSLSVFMNALSLPSDNCAATDSFDKIVAKAKMNGAIVVVFPEGTTSNGRGLLPMAEIPVSLTQANVFPSAVKYTHPSVITAIPVNVLVYLWKLLGVWVNASIKLATPASATGNDSQLKKEIAEGICRVGRVRQVGDYLNGESKREFVVAWNRYHK